MKRVMIFLLAIVLAGEAVAAGELPGAAETHSSSEVPLFRFDKTSDIRKSAAPGRRSLAADFASEMSLSGPGGLRGGSRPGFEADNFAGGEFPGLRSNILRFSTEIKSGASELETDGRKKTYSGWILPVAVIIGVGLTTYALYSVRSR